MCGVATRVYIDIYTVGRQLSERVRIAEMFG